MAYSDPLAQPGRASRLAQHSLAWLSRSWPFLAFFVGFFLIWELSVGLFSIPAYILPKPSEIETSIKV